MEFSVTGDQQVELTAMSLDESEGCLLTGLRDGTVKMWNYSVGECLLTFPNADQLEVSLAHRGPWGPLTAPVTPSMCYFSCLPERLCTQTPWLCASLSLCA